jgi:hypothetical protein
MDEVGSKFSVLIVTIVDAHRRDAPASARRAALVE